MKEIESTPFFALLYTAHRIVVYKRFAFRLDLQLINIDAILDSNVARVSPAPVCRLHHFTLQCFPRRQFFSFLK